MSNENDKEKAPQETDKKASKIGQGFNDARGEIADKKDIPAHNGQNVNNDPSHKHPKP